MVYLVKNDIEEIKAGFGRNTAAHDWLSSALEEKNDDVIERAAQMVQMKSAYIGNGAHRFGFRVVDTGSDFTRTIEELSEGL